jgi:hypothetical protein
MQPNEPIAIYRFKLDLHGTKFMKLRSQLVLAATIAILVSPQVEAASRYDDVFDLFLERTTDSEERASRPAIKRRKLLPSMRESQEALSIFDLFTSGGPAPKKKEAIKVNTPAMVVLPRTERRAVKPKPVQLQVKKYTEPIVKPRSFKPPRIEPPAVKLATRPPIKPVVPPSKVSCHDAKAIIEKYAFDHVSAQNCGGDVYTFAATRTGKKFLIKVGALRGELIEVKKTPAPDSTKSLVGTE